jgi:hypothetical protein
MIPTAVHDIFTQIAFYAFEATLLIVFLAWLLRHLLDIFESLIIRVRKFWISIRRELPEPPPKVIHNDP